MSQTASQPKSITADQSKRRQLLLGTGATLLLAACGGGGGGDNEGQEISLRTAYDKLERGMTKDVVFDIINREPYHKGYDNWVYRDGDETLMVHYGSYQGLQGILVTGIDWWTSGSGAQSSLTK